jgi:hypothetical protein
MWISTSRIHNNTAPADGGGLALLSAQYASIAQSSVQHNKVRRLQYKQPAAWRDDAGVPCSAA